jgi:hypothetical protein
VKGGEKKMHHTQSRYHCDCQSVCSQLWSKSKKIRVLQQRLKVIDDQKKEIETLIGELNEE